MAWTQIGQPESKRKATSQGLMSAAIPPKSSAREHQPGGKHDETIDAVLHNDSTAVRVTIGRRGVKSTPTSPSKADAGPQSARTRNWRAANDLRQAARTPVGAALLEFCKASSRTPYKKRMGDPDFLRPDRPFKASKPRFALPKSGLGRRRRRLGRLRWSGWRLPSVLLCRVHGRFAILLQHSAP